MSKVVLNKKDADKIINRMAHEIIESVNNIKNIVIIGIAAGGIPVAEKIAAAIKKYENINMPLGKLDISLYRDDLQIKENLITVKESDIDFDIDNKNILIVDDVIQSGRTVRAAMDALLDLGRPKTIKLAALIDKGQRELPIEANFIGKKITANKKDKIVTDFIKDNVVIIEE